MKKLIFLFLVFFLNFAVAVDSKPVTQVSLPENVFVNEFYTNSASNIVLGNPNGSVTIVEMYDYNCMYCKLLATQLDKLIAKNKDVRLVRIPVGILADSSIIAAKYAIAAQMQCKFAKFDSALMRAKDIDVNTLNTIAKQAGLNMTNLQTDLTSNKLLDQVITNERIIGFSFLMTSNAGLPMTLVAKTVAPHTNILITGDNLDQIKTAVAKFSGGGKLSNFYPKTNKNGACSG